MRAEVDALPRVCSLEAPLLERARGGLPTEASSIHYILVSEGLSARVSARPCLAYVHFKEMPYEFGMRPASKPWTSAATSHLVRVRASVCGGGLGAGGVW